MKKLYKQQNFYLPKDDLESLSAALSQSYADGFGVNLEEGANLPRRREILSVTSKLEELLFPGFDGEERYRLETISYSAAKLLESLYAELCNLTVRCFCYMCKKNNVSHDCRTEERSREAVLALLKALPAVILKQLIPATLPPAVWTKSSSVTRRSKLLKSSVWRIFFTNTMFRSFPV